MALAHGDLWDQFAERLRELESLLSQSTARTIRSRRIRETARALAQQFFREARPHLVTVGIPEAELASLDAPVRELLEISHRHAERSTYVRRITQVRRGFAGLVLLREMQIGRTTSVAVAVLTPIEDRIVQTLERLSPIAAQAYLQATIDLSGPPRHSYRGVAHEFREALRETLDRFAPDADVMAQPGFVLEPGQTRPTQRQKALFVLRRRRRLPANARSAPEQAVSMVEELAAAIARSTYTRGSISAHSSTPATEVRQMKMYVDAVLAELLEIHGKAFNATSTGIAEGDVEPALEGLRRLVLRFRSLGKGRLGRFRDHAWITKGPLDVAIRERLIQDGVLTREGDMYFLDASAFGRIVGATHQDLKLKHFNAKVRQYAASISMTVR